MFAIITSVLITVAVYMFSKKLYIWRQSILLTPLVIAPFVLIMLLCLTGTAYDRYNAGASYLTFMLQPATVALAVPLYKYREIVKKYFWEIIMAVLAGTITAIISSIMIAQLLGLSVEMMLSMAPRSITTPMAMSLAQALGGNPAITAIFVIITGVLGSIIGPALFKLVCIKNPVTKGLLLGVAAHGAGTSKAYEFGKLEGSVASLAMIFMGIITTLLAPELVTLCMKALHVA